MNVAHPSVQLTHQNRRAIGQPFTTATASVSSQGMRPGQLGISSPASSGVMALSAES
jgi:hypothetical protein